MDGSFNDYHIKGIIIIIIKEVRQQGALKGTISPGGVRKRIKAEKWKSRSEEKGVSFSSDSLFPTRKWKAVSKVEPNK